MLRLTLRSGRDGRFLARIIDRGGFAFVLDYGDGRIIQDAAQRLSKGFTMWRLGRLVTVGPHHDALVPHLAELYASEGLLVFLEEPGWLGRGEGRAQVSSGAVVGEDQADELGEADDSTDVASPEDVQRVMGLQTVPTPDRAVRITFTPGPVSRRSTVVRGRADKRLPLHRHLQTRAGRQPVGEDDPTEVVPRHDLDTDEETDLLEREP